MRLEPVMMMMFTPERHLPTSGQHGPAPSGTPPPAQPPPPPQTRETQSHSAPTLLKRPMLTPEGGPRPKGHHHHRVSALRGVPESYCGGTSKFAPFSGRSARIRRSLEARVRLLPRCGPRSIRDWRFRSTAPPWWSRLPSLRWRVQTVQAAERTRACWRSR